MEVSAHVLHLHFCAILERVLRGYWWGGTRPHPIVPGPPVPLPCVGDRCCNQPTSIDGDVAFSPSVLLTTPLRCVRACTLQFVFTPTTLSVHALHVTKQGPVAYDSGLRSYAVNFNTRTFTETRLDTQTGTTGTGVEIDDASMLDMLKRRIAGDMTLDVGGIKLKLIKPGSLNAVVPPATVVFEDDKGAALTIQTMVWDFIEVNKEEDEDDDGGSVGANKAALYDDGADVNELNPKLMKLMLAGASLIVVVMAIAFEYI